MNTMPGWEVLALRHRLQLSQAELAQRMAVSERTIRRWETDGCAEFVARFLVLLAENV